MNQTSIRKIEEYLVQLPDSTESQVIHFLDYLNYKNHVDSDALYLDEIEAMEEFKKDSKTYSWEDIKNEL